MIKTRAPLDTRKREVYNVRTRLSASSHAVFNSDAEALLTLTGSRSASGNGASVRLLDGSEAASVASVEFTVRPSAAFRRAIMEETRAEGGWWRKTRGWSGAERARHDC